MNINSVKFIKSSATLKQCPPAGLPEFAFIGRSNVGKSSLINMLTGRKGLAKVSGTPGKTRLINHFLVNDSWYIVDLPGYGFAKISREERTRLAGMIEEYLLNRRTVKLIFLLVDSRLEPQKSDLDFIAGLFRLDLPFLILLTKSDKLTRNELSRNTGKYQETLEGYFSRCPVLIPCSSRTGFGKERILGETEELLKEM
ncbi:MAG TPA: ribosome biogenesis GTP-binding protein YihA/YsxC [Bacteroidales bacterium]|nr:ribosome biogenesis GTP-binding protein YihA/YsxC [Bacteroidales bacterium]